MLHTSFDNLAGEQSSTVSPKDLMIDTSAPPSTSLTDLSTPSFESPGLFSQDTSPMFSDLDLMAGSEDWAPLFPTQELDVFSTAFDSATPGVGVALAAEDVVEYKDVAAQPAVTIACISSPVQSPAPNKGARHSSVAGVNARQKKPLPAIKFDATDPVAAKRARNTEAARKSRARKLERQEDMEKRIAELEKSLEEAQQREQYWKALAQGKA